MFGLPKRQYLNNWADACLLEHPKDFPLMAVELASSRRGLSFLGGTAQPGRNTAVQGMHMPGTCAPRSFSCAFILKTQSDGQTGKGQTGLPFLFKKS